MRHGDGDDRQLLGTYEVIGGTDLFLEGRNGRLEDPLRSMPNLFVKSRDALNILASY
jgi:hypothetical protein